MPESISCTFLPHACIFKPDKETTKVRMLFIFNLADKFQYMNNVSQAMYAGPYINQKLTTSLILLRFHAKILCFDVHKALLQNRILESDGNKICFYMVHICKKGGFFDSNVQKFEFDFWFSSRTHNAYNGSV